MAMIGVRGAPRPPPPTLYTTSDIKSRVTKWLFYHHNLASSSPPNDSILFLDACSSQWYPCAQCLASSLSILIIPIALPALIIERRDVGIWTVNRESKFISTKYIQRPEMFGAFCYLRRENHEHQQHHASLCRP